MVWVDRAVGEIRRRFAEEIAKGKPLVIRDEKTLSGRVHVGSLRGIAIHGLIGQVLRAQNISCIFKFELNDFDPMDAIPATLDHTQYEKYMGQPLYTVPSPREGHENYPMVFGDELKGVVEPLGFPIEWYTLRPHYQQGDFNDVIHLALDHAAEIRAIYKEVSGSMKPDDWYPLQVICEKCGKVGTTQVTQWNGKTVIYECKKNLVQWAEGCNHRGEISPFDGHAKLPWKVEWPAKWKVFGVTIEGAGKDHSAAGGSRDIGKRIVEEIFHYPEPYNIPYEFFNVRGKKMSASKGIGASSKEIADLLPPKLLKLLMIRKAPNQPIDFDPEGTTIPLLFDGYDQLADHYFKRHPNPDTDSARTFHLTQIDFPTPPRNIWHMRFSLLSFIVQMPHIQLLEEAEHVKSAKLTVDEIQDLQERTFYVKQWLKKFAPQEYRYAILAKSPMGFSVDVETRRALEEAKKALSSVEWKGEAIHAALHEVKRQTGIAPKNFFSALYQAFLGRQSGPQMGWFLSTFSREQVIGRIEAIT